MIQRSALCDMRMRAIRKRDAVPTHTNSTFPAETGERNMFRYLVPADWPPIRPGMFAGSFIVLPGQRDVLDALREDVLMAKFA